MFTHHFIYLGKNLTPQIYRLSVTLTLTTILLGWFGNGQILAQENDDEIIEVVITDINDETFPEMSVSVAVFNNDQTVDDLTIVDLQLTEAGQLILPSAIRDITPDPGIHLILGVDVSVPDDDDFVAMIDQVTGFVSNLSKQDHLTLIQFSNSVETVDTFMSPAEATQALQAIESGGDRTALYQAIFETAEASDTASSKPADAVILITDSQNNATGTTLDTATEQAQLREIPFYIIGFGERVEPDQPIKTQIETTGGRYLTLDLIADIQSEIQQLVQPLRSGHTIHYTSQIPVDDNEHVLDILLEASDDSGQTETTFVARSGPVSIDLIGVEAYQLITNTVTFEIEAETPGEIAEVTYYINGVPQTGQIEAPHTYIWNPSASQTGPYTITAQVEDHVGNRGMSSPTLIQVVQPPKVSLGLSNTAIEFGQTIPLDINIDSALPIAKTEILLDNILIFDSTAPSDYLSLNSGDYSAGIHTLLIRVEDSLGLKGETEQTLEFLPQPEPFDWRTPLIKSVLSLLIILVGLISMGLVLWLLRLIIGWQKRRLRRTFPLEIINLGNITSRYELKANTSNDLLIFQFQVKGKPLPQRQWTEPIPTTTPIVHQSIERASAGVPPLQPTPQNGASKAPSTTSFTSSDRTTSENFDHKQTIEQTKQGAQKAKKAVSGFRGVANGVAGILNTAGSILPRAIGTPLKQMGNNLRQAQGQVDQIARQPQRFTNTAKSISNQAQGLAQSQGLGQPKGLGSQDNKTLGQTKSTPNPNISHTATQPLTNSTTITETANRQPPPQPTRLRTITSEWLETPLVETGDTLSIALMVNPIRSFQRGTYPFTINSRPIEPTEPVITKTEGEINVKGLSRIIRGFLLLLTAALIAGLVLMVLYLVNEIWQMDIATLPIIGNYLIGIS